MKISISYFLFALTVSSVATGSGQGPVLDMDGDIISTGSYYVLPFIKGQGGGVTLAPHAGNYPCSLDIVQESSDIDIDKGLPVKFSNWKSKVGFVPLNLSLNIETDIAATMCMQPTYWWVDWVIIETHKTQFPIYLTAGPNPKEYKGDYLICSFFKIEETNDKNVYKIMFCPEDLPRNNKVSSEPSCGNVGIIVDQYRVRRLGFTESNPFLVQFKKAKVIESVLSKNM